MSIESVMPSSHLILCRPLLLLPRLWHGPSRGVVTISLDLGGGSVALRGQGFTGSWSLFKLMSIELVMPSNHLILCRLLLLLPSIFPSIRVFSNGLALPFRWTKYWVSEWLGYFSESVCSPLPSPLHSVEPLMLLLRWVQT